MGAAARCVAFSADGVWLAAGLVDGTVEVLRVGGGGAAVAASRVTRLREGDREVSALGFSPDGGTLAVGTAEGVVGLFDTATWRRLARCTGHATTVAHVDWSRDSSTVQTNCRGYEILYWEGRSGRQLLGAQRDWEAWEGGAAARLAGDGDLARRLRRRRHQRGARVGRGAASSSPPTTAAASCCTASRARRVARRVAASARTRRT